jgi:hypothetical protein
MALKHKFDGVRTIRKRNLVFVVVISICVGFVLGVALTNSTNPSTVDLVAGTIVFCVIVLLCAAVFIYNER